jgi:1-phosphofructokinase
MRSLILALNPSIDAEWRVDDVLWEEKNNVQSERRWAGGKGINVARWLKHLGGKPQLLLPLGGDTGLELAGYLHDEKIPAHIIHLHESTRVNVIVTTKRRRQMRFNPLGPMLSPQEWSEIQRQVKRRLSDADLLVLSGSLPRGVPVSVYRELIRQAHHAGVRTLLDCDGPAFVAGVKARPYLVKPNEHELAQWWGKAVKSEHQIATAARALSKKTGGWVLVSRGAKRSLLVNLERNFQTFAAPECPTPKNTVGAGDALLAAVAFQIAKGSSPDAWLRHGLAIGTAATQLAAGELPNPANLMSA